MTGWQDSDAGGIIGKGVCAAEAAEILFRKKRLTEKEGLLFLEKSLCFS